MRILYFYQYFGTPNGSWSTRAYELSRRWVAAGHQVTVVTAPYYKSDLPAKGFIRRTNIDGINVVIINAPDSNKKSTLKRAINAIVFSLTAIYFALVEKADVCISSSGPITIAIPSLMAKWVRKIPFVFEVRDLWPRGAIELRKINNFLLIKIALWFEKLIYKNATAFISCSPGMAQGVKDVKSDVDSLVITNASDVSLFQRKVGLPNSPIFNKIRDKHIFLYAGSLGLMDDCSQAIKAMQFVDDPSIVLLFAGDGAERHKLEELASKIGANNIFFLGLIPKTEVVKWFSVASASIITFKDYPVLHTSSPNKMFDSFAAGVPIIQTTRGWIKELVEKKNCGLNADPLSPETIAQAMQEIVYNDDLQSEMAKNALELAKKDFNRDYLADTYLNKLKAIAKKKK